MRILLDDALLVTQNPGGDVFRGSLLVENGRIGAIVPEGERPPPAGVRRSLGGHALLPGFVQTHVHGCQTLFRGAADDLRLLDWLKRRIWPLEAAHDPSSIAASMQLAAVEMLKGGTTAFLSMETVRHTDVAFETLRAIPIRAVIGKCLMNEGEDVPDPLREDGVRGLDEALALGRAFPPAEGARLRACLAPRFALSCSEGLLRDVGDAARAHDLLVHTHGAEQVEEVELVRRATGRRNLEYLDHVGLANERLRLAHVVHLDAAEEDRLVASRTHVLHCPSSNLKLGSGIAPISRYLERGVPVSIGADGAPCNNNLDALREARLAALLQKPSFGPTALPAARALRLVTIDGAAALGMADEIGSLEVGKRADLVEIDLGGIHVIPNGDVASRVIYAADRSDIVRVYVDGEVVVERGRPTFLDEDAVKDQVERNAAALFSRAGLAR